MLAKVSTVGNPTETALPPIVMQRARHNEKRRISDILTEMRRFSEHFKLKMLQKKGISYLLSIRSILHGHGLSRGKAFL